MESFRFDSRSWGRQFSEFFGKMTAFALRSVRRLPRLLGVFLGHAFHGHQGVAFVEAHDPHALRVAADDADVAGGDPLDLAAGGHHQHFVVVADADDADHRAVALGGLDVAHALAAAALRAVAIATTKSLRLRPRLRSSASVVRLGRLRRPRLVVAVGRRRRRSAVSAAGRRPPGCWGRRACACRSRWRRRSAAWPRDRPRPCRPPGRPCSGGCLSRRWSCGPSAGRRTRLKRMAMPLAVASTISSPVLGHDHVDQFVVLA